MAEGRSKVQWNHTSSVMALLFNVNRDPKRGKPAKPRDFNPHMVKVKRERVIPVSRLLDDIMGPIERKRKRRG